MTICIAINGPADVSGGDLFVLSLPLWPAPSNICRNDNSNDVESGYFLFLFQWSVRLAPYLAFHTCNFFMLFNLSLVPRAPLAQIMIKMTKYGVKIVQCLLDSRCHDFQIERMPQVYACSPVNDKKIFFFFFVSNKKLVHCL